MPVHNGKSVQRCRPDVRFIAVSSVLVGIFLLAYREDVMGGPLFPLVELTARATAWLLGGLGLDVARTAGEIRHVGGFAYEIYYRCTGVLPAALLAILILVHPGSWRSKGLGLVLGIPVLGTLNLLRLVHLFLLGVHSPGAFELAHGFFWEAVLMAATLGLWLAWRRRSARPRAGCRVPSSVLPGNPLS